MLQQTPPMSPLVIGMATVSGFSEFDERMRLRLGVEPLAWTLQDPGTVGSWRAARSARA